MREIGERLNVSRGAVVKWRKRFPDFPQPVEKGDWGEFMWVWSHVQTWAEKHGRWDDVVGVPLRRTSRRAYARRTK